MFTTLKRVLKLGRSVYGLGERLKAEEAAQAKLGYKVEHEFSAGDSWVTYREGAKFTTVPIYFLWDNTPVILTQGLAEWETPEKGKIEALEYQLVLSRIAQYLSAWGDVTYDDTPMVTADEIKAGLIEAGIPFEELDGGVISYTSTVDKERTRKGGFFTGK